MVKPILMPASVGQALGPGLTQVIEQLDRHCLAPDGSLVLKSTYYDLLLAREEMGRERLRYLEALAVYSEVLALVEEYQLATSMANSGGIRDCQSLFLQLGLRSSPEVYEALEQYLVVAEAMQRLRLPLVSKDGEILEEVEGNNGDVVASASTSMLNNLTISMGSLNIDPADSGVGGVVNRFLGVTPSWLHQTHISRSPFAKDRTTYQMALAPEIESRLKSKCDKLSMAFALDEADIAGANQNKSLRLPERVKLVVEEIEREEGALLEDLYSADRKFSEYYNVLEQILGVLFKLVKDFKLQYQHQYDGLRKSWLCKRCQTMNAKLRVLEHLLLRDTYTQESIPALHKIRSYLVEAKDESTAGYKRAVTRLREYQGVDKDFDDIARRYHETVQKLEGIQWTIRQVEMDLNNGEEH